MLLLLECLLLDEAIEKTEDSNNNVNNNVFPIIVILVMFFSFLVSGAQQLYISIFHTCTLGVGVS